MNRQTALSGLLVGAAMFGSMTPTLAVAQHRLGPGAERAVSRCVGLDEPSLVEGVELTGFGIDRDHVRLDLQGPEITLQIRLFAPDDGRAGRTLTRIAAIEAPENTPTDVISALAARLDRCALSIPFVREVMVRDDALAEARAKNLSTRVRARLGLEASEARWQASASLTEGLAKLEAGQRGPLLEGLREALRSPEPPVGSLSLWLAAGGDAQPCGSEVRCPAGEALTDLLDGHLRASWSSQWSQEPRFLVHAAERAVERGDPARARAWLLLALAAEIPDQVAVDLSRDWGWGPGSTVGGLPGRGPVTGADAAGGSSPLLPLGAAFIFALALWRVRDERPGFLVGSVGLLVGLLALLALPGGGGGAQTPAYEEVDGQVLRWGRGLGCEMGWPTVMDGALYNTCQCGEERAGVMVRPQQGGIEVSMMPTVGTTRGGAATERWQRSVAKEKADGLATRLGVREAPDPGLGSLATRWSRLDPHQRRALVDTGPVAILTLFALLALLAMALQGLRERARGCGGARWRLTAALVLGATAHTVAPSAMVMVYGGYGQVAELVNWEPLRYGAGANWLYGPWLETLGFDHAVVQTMNRLYGLLACVFLVAWAEKLAAASAGYVALLLAMSPILWRDHASESILVGGLMVLSAGLYGLAHARRGAIAPAILAAPCLVLAAFTRPEFALFALPLAALTWVQTRSVKQLDRHAWTTLGFAAASALLLAPSALAYLEASTRWLVETGALPGMDALGSRFLGDAANPGRAFIDLAWWLPILTLPLALLGAAWRGSRGLGVGLLVICLAWMAFTRVDLPAVSVPRVHAPVATLLLVLAGVGLARLLPTLAGWSGGRWPPVIAWAVLSLWWCFDVSLVSTWLYAPTNAESEEQLLRATEEAIEGSGVCLATLDSRDPPARGKTPRSWPSYLFTGRDQPVRLLGLAEVEEALPVCRGEIYALLGMRCYMALRDEETETSPPSGSPLIEGCATFKERWNLEEVVVTEATNHGDVAYPLYPDGERLSIGLYRLVRGAADEAPDTRDRRSPRR